MSEEKEIVTTDAPIQQITVNDSTSMLQAVGVLAMDPNTDVEKIERLMAIQERLQAKENEARFNQIMAGVQENIKTAIKNRHNEQTHSNYADLSSVLKNTRDAYTVAGMALSFDTEPSDDASIVRLVCHVTAAGHSRTYRYDSPLTDKGIAGKTMMSTAHARGSAISYGRRYLTLMIFNLDTADDDDANACADIEWITPEQVETIKGLLKRISDNTKEKNYGKTMSRFLGSIGAQSVARIQGAAYQGIINNLSAKAGVQ